MPFAPIATKVAHGSVSVSAFTSEVLEAMSHPWRPGLHQPALDHGHTAGQCALAARAPLPGRAVGSRGRLVRDRDIGHLSPELELVHRAHATLGPGDARAAVHAAPRPLGAHGCVP